MKQTVLVTGASRGIGYATALQFAENGYKVFALWHNAPEKLTDVGTLDITAVQGDVSSLASMQKVYAEIGAVDILVNNAAISHFGLLTDLSEEEWDHILSVNLKSVFLTAKVFLPDMIRKKSGKILNISSIFGAVGGSCEVAYSTAKAGMIGFTKALAKEVGPSGVQVNCIAPGVIETEMNARLSDADKAALADETPLGRIGTPKEVADLALYLAKDTFITGEVIHIGGGFLR
ncbi:MAG: SDR family oxidoreductase [Clostridia bacterium]|nr:SDR family oxidoreductase [Clostridia bacterium]